MRSDAAFKRLTPARREGNAPPNVKNEHSNIHKFLRMPNDERACARAERIIVATGSGK